MTDLPIGIGFVDWVVEITQNATPVAFSIDGYHVVTDTWTAMTGGGPQWLSGVITVEFGEAGPGTGEIDVFAPPNPDYPAGVDWPYVCGHASYRSPSNDLQTELGVWIGTNGRFYFTESGVSAGERFGAQFTIATGDVLSFCFRYPIGNAPPA